MSIEIDPDLADDANELLFMAMKIINDIAPDGVFKIASIRYVATNIDDIRKLQAHFEEWKHKY